MARKNLTDVISGSAQSVQPHPVGSKQRPTKYFHNSTSKYFKAITPPPHTVGTPVVGSEQQQQPRNSSQGKTSPRTSPGLLGRHYAGCKFSEPPAPTMLPLPPQHWTLTSSAHVSAAQFALNQQQLCLTQQLKVLLKVQA